MLKTDFKVGDLVYEVYDLPIMNSPSDVYRITEIHQGTHWYQHHYRLKEVKPPYREFRLAWATMTPVDDFLRAVYNSTEVKL